MGQQNYSSALGQVFRESTRGGYCTAKKLAVQYPVSAVCAVILLGLIVVAIAAPWLAPYPHNRQHLSDSLASPSKQYLLGTDHLGRDVLSRTIMGARVSLTVGFGAMAIGTVLATMLGGISGYIAGRIDAVIQRFVDAFMSVPTLILLMTVMSVVGTSLLHMIIVISVSMMISSSRTVRSAVITVKANPYVEAARVLGAGPVRVFFHHVLPNITAPIIVIASLMIGYAILIEASLSFLGFGVPPPHPTWGGMLAGEGRTYMLIAPWMALAPGIVLTVVILSINLVGDGLRDILDPRLRGGE